MELWQYDATDLARLIRTGQASAREAVDFGPEAPACGQSHDQRRRARARAGGARRRGDRRRRPRARPCPAAAARRAGDDQGQRRPDRPADRQRRGPAKRLHRQGGQPGRRQPQARRRDHRRSHQCAGLLHAHLHRQRPARLHLQPARPDGDARRLERRRGCGDGDRHRRHRPWQRHRRFGAHPRLLQRRGRAAHRLRPHSLAQSQRTDRAGRSAPS